MSELSAKQEKFCYEFSRLLNATQAAILAGYSEKTARQLGSQLLSNVNIQEKLAQIRLEYQQETKIDVAWVMNRFKEISDRCMTVEPVMKFDPVERQMVQETAPNEKGEEVGVYTFDSSGANKATEMLGKMIGAFEVDNSQKSKVIMPAQINLIGSPDTQAD